MIHARVAVVGIELYICEVVCSACRVKPAVDRRTKRSFRPNLQSVRTTSDGENTRLRVCGKCLKAGKVQRVAA